MADSLGWLGPFGYPELVLFFIKFDNGGVGKRVVVAQKINVSTIALGTGFGNNDSVAGLVLFTGSI